MEAAGGAYLPPKSLPEGGWTRPAGFTFRRRACRREDGHGRRSLPSAEELAGGRMDTAGGAYLPPKNLPERGWTRQAGLIFRRRACRREDGHGRRGLPSAEELAEAGGWMRQTGFIFRRRACRREDGHGRRGLSSAEEIAGGRMDAAGGAYLPPKNLPEGGWTRPAGLTFRRRDCRREDGCGRRDLPSAEELAEAGGWMRYAGLIFRRRTCRGGRRTMKRRSCRCRPVPAKPGSIPFHTRRKPPAFCRVR